MAVSVTFAGNTYSIPNSSGENGWASNLTSYLQAIASNAATSTIQKQSIRTALTSPINFTATDYCVISNLTTPSAVSVILPVGTIGQLFSIVDGKGDAGTNNITVSCTSGQLINGVATYIINKNYGATAVEFDGVGYKIISSFVGDNPQFSSIRINTLTTGIAHLDTNGNLSSSLLVNADVSASAAIAYSKLSLTNSIVNADLSSSAAIALTKLAPVAVSKALVSDAGGLVSASAVTATELGYLTGVFGNVQSQMTGTANSLNAHTSATTVHGIAGSVVGTTDTQTLTNKTLSTGTAITAGKITTAVNEVDATDNTKQLITQLSGAATATSTTLVMAQTANRVVTFPDATDTLVGKSTTDNLSNKTLTSPILNTPLLPSYSDRTGIATPAAPAAGNLRVYSKTDNKLYIQTSAGAETALLRVGDAGGGDTVGPAASVDSEIALFSATSGKLLKRATGTGYAKVSSGVLLTPSATIPTTDIAGTTSGSAVGAGILGQVLTASVSLTNLTTGMTNVCSLTLTAGIWLVYGSITINMNGTASPGTLFVDTSLVSATADAGYRVGDMSGVATNKYLNMVPRVVNTNGSSGNIVYAVAQIGSTAGGPPQASAGGIYAVRTA